MANIEVMLTLDKLASHTYIPVEILTHFEKQGYIVPDKIEEGVSFYSKETAEYIRNYREAFLLTYKNGSVTIANEYEDREYGEEQEREPVVETDFEEENESDADEEEWEELEEEIDEDSDEDLDEEELDEEELKEKKKKTKKNIKTQKPAAYTTTDQKSNDVESFSPEFDYSANAYTDTYADSYTDSTFDSSFDTYVDTSINRYFESIPESYPNYESISQSETSSSENILETLSFDEYTRESAADNIISDIDKHNGTIEQAALAQKLSETNREYVRKQSELKSEYEEQLKIYANPDYVEEKRASIYSEYKEKTETIVKEEIQQRRELMDRLSKGEITEEEYREGTRNISDIRAERMQNLEKDKEASLKETELQQTIKMAEAEKQYRVQSVKNSMERDLATGLAIDAIEASKFKASNAVREMQSRNKESLETIKTVWAISNVYGDKIFENIDSQFGEIDYTRVVQNAAQAMHYNPEKMKEAIYGNNYGTHKKAYQDNPAFDQYTKRNWQNFDTSNKPYAKDYMNDIWESTINKGTKSKENFNEPYQTNDGQRDKGTEKNKNAEENYSSTNSRGKTSKENALKDNIAKEQRPWNHSSKDAFSKNAIDINSGTFYDNTFSKKPHLWKTARRPAEQFTNMAVRQIVYSNDAGRGYREIAPYITIATSSFKTHTYKMVTLRHFRKIQKSGLVELHSHMKRLNLDTKTLFTDEGKYVGNKWGQQYWKLLRSFNEDTEKYENIKAKLALMGITLDKVNLLDLVHDKNFYKSLTKEEKELIITLQGLQKHNFKIAQKSLPGIKSAFAQVYKNDPALKNLLKGKKLEELSVAQINIILKDKKFAAYHGYFKEYKRVKKIDINSRRANRDKHSGGRVLKRYMRQLLSQNDLGRGFNTTMQYTRMMKGAIRVSYLTVRGTGKVSVAAGKLTAKKVLGTEKYAKASAAIHDTKVVKTFDRAKEFKKRRADKKLQRKEKRRTKIRNVKTRIKNHTINSKPMTWLKRTKIGKITTKTGSIVGGGVRFVGKGIGSVFNFVSKIKTFVIGTIVVFVLLWLITASAMSLIAVVSSTIVGFFEEDEQTLDNVGQTIMNTLIDTEATWYNSIYDIGNQEIDSTEEEFLGAYGQSLEGLKIGEDYVRINFVDQNGVSSAYTTNIKEVMSMGAVYLEQNFQRSIPYLDYCLAVWKISHKWDSSLPWVIDNETWYNTNKYHVVLGKTVCANIKGIEESTGNEIITCNNVVYCGQENERFTEENQRRLEESHPECKIVTWSYSDSVTRDDLIHGTYTNDGIEFFDAAESSYDVHNGTLKYTYAGEDNTVYSRYRLWVYSSSDTLIPTETEQVFARYDDEFYNESGVWKKVSYDHTETRYRYTVETATVTWNCEGHCGGHITADVTCKVVNFEGGNNIFVLSDKYYVPRSEEGEQGWSYTEAMLNAIYPIDSETGERKQFAGFTTTDENGNIVESDMAEWARNLATQDWYDLYGISLSQGGMAVASLTAAEIQEILDALPEDLSEDRYNTVKWALESVGKIPYYWGGNASAPGYEENNFGSTVPADIKGRTLKGLDCSGYLGWLYWSAVGDSSYTTYSARSFSQAGTDAWSNPQPGDIFAYPTDESNIGGSGYHCGVIVGVNDDGTLNIVHTPGAPYNNVLYEVGKRYERWEVRSLLN